MNPRNWLVLGGCVLAVGFAVAAGAQGPPDAPAPPAAQGAAPTGTPAQGAARGGRGGGGGRGPAYPVHPQADDATIARGQALFSTNCSFCHGSDARGGEGGPNLVRSQLVMNDDKGELIATVVQNGRPGTMMPKFDLSAAQIADIAGYIHKVGANYRAVVDIPTNIVVGDAKAGEAYFSGPGKCSTCHSVTGDLAGIGGKMDPKGLQNAIVSGGGGRGAGLAVQQTTATVTLPTGKVVEGKLTHLDDFIVTVTGADGAIQSFARNGDVPKVAVHNPLQPHIDMLPGWNDDDIHNLTAYLVTVK